MSYFLTDIAEFERGRKIKLKKSERVSSLGGQKSILNNQAIKGSLLYEDLDPVSNPDSFSKMKLYPRGMAKTFNAIPNDSKGVLHSTVTTKRSNNKFVTTPRYLKHKMLTDLKNAGVNVSRIKASSPHLAEGYKDVQEGVKKMYNERNQTKVSTKSKPTVTTSVTPNKPTVKHSVTTNNITKTVTNNVKPPKLNKYLLGTGAITGVAALGGLGYLGYKKLTNKKRRNK